MWLGNQAEGWCRRFVRKVAAGGQRFGWGIADQGLSSLTNLATGVIIVRTLGAQGLGVFTLAFTTYLVGLNISRGLATDPLMIRYAGVDRDVWRRATSGSTGTALVVGAVLGLACVIPKAVSTVLAEPGDISGPGLVDALGALGLVLPGLLVQDAWRYAFFVSGRGVLAFLNDLTWAVVQAVLFYALIIADLREPGFYVLAWGGAASVAALVGVMQAQLFPRPSRSWRWLAGHRDLGSRYVVENMSFGVEYQLRTYGIGVVAGYQALGTYRAAELLLGPVFVLYMGLQLVILPRVVTLARESIRSAQKLCVLVSVVLSMMVAVLSAAVLALPDEIGSAFLGDGWATAKSILLPMALYTALECLTTGAMIGLRGLADARRSLRTRLISSATRLVLCLLGAALGGVAGAAWGLVAACTFSCPLWWWEFKRSGRSRSGDEQVVSAEREI